MDKERPGGIRIGESHNEYGTTVSVHLCFGCGAEFVVCPPAGDRWGGCLAESCPTYDSSRDIDKHWDAMQSQIKRGDCK